MALQVVHGGRRRGDAFGAERGFGVEDVAVFQQFRSPMGAEQFIDFRLIHRERRPGFFRLRVFEGNEQAAATDG